MMPLPYMLLRRRRGPLPARFMSSSNEFDFIDFKTKRTAANHNMEVLERTGLRLGVLRS